MMWACTASPVLHWTGENDEEIRSFFQDTNNGCTYTSQIDLSGHLILTGSDFVYPNFDFPPDSYIVQGAGYTPAEFAERFIVVPTGE